MVRAFSALSFLTNTVLCESYRSQTDISVAFTLITIAAIFCVLILPLSISLSHYQYNVIVKNTFNENKRFENDFQKSRTDFQIMNWPYIYMSFIVWYSTCIVRMWSRVSACTILRMLWKFDWLNAGVFI